jgi:formylglycine-generating enzyme required for sulfatase activity
VTIGKPFYLGKYEVTQAQWQAVMGSRPYLETRSNDFHELPGMASRPTGPDNPARVSWNDAQEFIKRLDEPGFPALAISSAAFLSWCCS